MDLVAVKFEFRDEKTKALLGDLFGDRRALQQRYGKNRHGLWVAETLDRLEQNQRAGIVYYDRKGTILHDRATLLATLHRDGVIYKPRGGAVRSRTAEAK